MRDAESLSRLSIAGLIGAVIGIVLVSLILSAYGAAVRRFDWDDLGSIATFWNGHLSSIVLLIFALGLYVQARQLTIQARAEQAQLARHRHELLRTSLDMLVARMAELGANLRAYVVDITASPMVIRTFSGVSQFAAVAVDSSLDDVEVWVDLPALNAYAKASGQMERLCKELVDVDPAGHLPVIYEFVTHRRIQAYSEKIAKKNMSLLETFRAACRDETALAHIREMLDQGWDIATYRPAGRVFLKARRLSPVFERIDSVSADNSDTMDDACKTLAKTWSDFYS